MPLGKLFLKAAYILFPRAMFLSLSAEIASVMVFGFSNLVLKSLGR